MSFGGTPHFLGYSLMGYNAWKHHNGCCGVGNQRPHTNHGIGPVWHCRLTSKPLAYQWASKPICKANFLSHLNSVRWRGIKSLIFFQKLLRSHWFKGCWGKQFWQKWGQRNYYHKSHAMWLGRRNVFCFHYSFLLSIETTQPRAEACSIHSPWSTAGRHLARANR